LLVVSHALTARKTIYLTTEGAGFNKLANDSENNTLSLFLTIKFFYTAIIQASDDRADLSLLVALNKFATADRHVCSPLIVTLDCLRARHERAQEFAFSPEKGRWNSKVEAR